jgi:hypothetical protein
MRIITPLRERAGCLLLMVSPELCSMLHNFESMFHEFHQQHTSWVQEDSGQALPADNVTLYLFLGEPVCFHCMVVCLLVGVKWWAHVSSPDDLMLIVVSLSCIMLQETERPSFYLLCCHLLTHEPTIWNRSYNTLTHFPQYAAQCHRIN